MAKPTYDSRGYEKADVAAESVMRASALDPVVMPRVAQVGDIVHYMPSGPSPSPLAAIITQCDADGCYLAVFTTTSAVFLKAPYCGDRPTPGCWSWPPVA